MLEVVPINIGFNRFVGNPDECPISRHIGEENLKNIREPAASRLFIYAAAALSFLLTVFALFLSIFLYASDIGQIATFLLFLSVPLAIFLFFVLNRSDGREDGELIALSPESRVEQIKDLFDYKREIVSGNIAVFRRRTIFSVHGDLSPVSVNIFQEDHGMLWLLGRERGLLLPKNVRRPIFMGDLFVKLPEGAARIPPAIERTLRLAAASPESLPQMSLLELDRLERALKLAGEWSEVVDGWFRLLRANKKLAPGISIERATEIHLLENTSSLAYQGARQVLGGRYPPLRKALLRASKQLNLQ